MCLVYKTQSTHCPRSCLECLIMDQNIGEVFIMTEIEDIIESREFTPALGSMRV